MSYKDQDQRQVVICQHSYCHSPAMSVIDNKNVCREHYDNHHHSEALKWNAVQGLDTVDKRKEYVNKALDQFKTVEK